MSGIFFFDEMRPMTDPWAHTITRDNVEQLLDDGLIEIYVGVRRGNHNWWKCRRNGQTKRWKKDLRLRIPVKAGMYVYGAICFLPDGSLSSGNIFRLKTFAR